MFTTIDINSLPKSYKAIITLQGHLIISTTSTEALSFKAGLLAMGFDCEIILIDSCKFELRHVSSWQAEEN